MKILNNIRRIKNRNILFRMAAVFLYTYMKFTIFKYNIEVEKYIYTRVKNIL